MKSKVILDNITVDTILEKGRCSHIDRDMVMLEHIDDMPKSNQPRRMGCLFLAICLRGSASYTVDTIRYDVKANDLIIISEGQIISDYTVSRDCMGMAFMLSHQFFNDIVKDITELTSLFLFSRTHPVCNLSSNEIYTINSYYGFIKNKTDNTDHHFRKDIVRSLFTAMIYDISNAIYRIQNFGSRKYTRAEDIFNKFIRLVELHFRRERRVSWYADKLDITAKYLSESVKQVSKRTPNEWIDNYVTIALRVLLRNTSKSIKEITQEMNFPNQSFLGTFFKEHVGMTPSQYRKGHSEE